MGQRRLFVDVFHLSIFKHHEVSDIRGSEVLCFVNAPSTLDSLWHIHYLRLVNGDICGALCCDLDALVTV